MVKTVEHITYWDKDTEQEYKMAIVQNDDGTWSWSAATANGASIDTFVQDQTTPALMLYFTQQRETNLSLFEDTVVDVNQIKVPTPSGIVGLAEAPLAPDYLGVLSGVGEFYFGDVLSVVVDEGGGGYDAINLAAPVDFVFTTALSVVIRTNKNLALSNGSVTPEIFEIRSGLNQSIDITRTMINIITTSAMDDGKFANLTAFTKGLVFRQANGEQNNLFSLRKNGDMRLLGYDLEYIDKAPAGQFALGWRLTFAGPSKMGVAQRIEPGEALQIINQEDLTGLIEFSWMAEGHVVEP